MTEDSNFEPLETALDQSSELAAMDILLRALICSHPKPGDLKLALLMLSESFHDQTRDYGFDTNRQTKAVQATTNNVQKRIERWLELLKDAPASKPSTGDGRAGCSLNYQAPISRLGIDVHNMVGLHKL